MLPTDYKARKALPLYTYLTQYHPDAIMELVKVAVAGNEQHNKGEPLHWAQGKSMDQLNTAVRHVFDHGQGNVYDTADAEYLAAAGITDSPGTMHLAKAAWRLLAEIQLLCDARAVGLPLEKMVRGTHEFMNANVPEPTPTPEVDYPRMGADVQVYDGQMHPIVANHVSIPAPLGTGPLEPASQPPVQSEVGKVGRGRVLRCGCFGSCGGFTPNCANWNSPPEDPTTHEAAGVYTNGDPR